MEWIALAAIALVVALAVRWAASALWVRMISERWSEFDAAEEPTGDAMRADKARGGRQN